MCKKLALVLMFVLGCVVAEFPQSVPDAAAVQSYQVTSTDSLEDSTAPVTLAFASCWSLPTGSDQ